MKEVLSQRPGWDTLVLSARGESICTSMHQISIKASVLTQHQSARGQSLACRRLTSEHAMYACL